MTLMLSPGPRAIVPVPEPVRPMGLVQRVISKYLRPQTSPMNVPDVITNVGSSWMVNQNTVLGRVAGAATYRAYASTPWVFAGINVRTDQIASAEWDIVPYDHKKRHAARQADALRELFDQPAATLDSFQAFAKKVISDILILDAGVIEKVRYPDGRIAELVPCRGEWIAVDERWDGSDPDLARYYFVPDGTVRAKFRNSDMVYMVANQRTNSQTGISPMLVLQTVIESELQALEYNRRQVMGAAPDGILNIGENASDAKVMETQSRFQAEVYGQGQMAVIGGFKAPEFIKFRNTNQEMQFREWEDILIRCIAVVLGISPMDLGITFDVNRSTAEQQSQNTDNRGLRTLMALFQNYLTREVVWDPAYGGRANNLQFAFKSLNLDETQTKAQINKIALGAVGWKSINEARQTDGRPPIGDSDDDSNIFNHVLTNTPKGMLDLTSGTYVGEEALIALQTKSKIDITEAAAEAAPAAPVSNGTAPGAAAETEEAEQE